MSASYDDEKAIPDMVIEDIRKRDEIGRKEYGTRLYAKTEIDGLQYAYEEALDLAIYLRHEIEKRG